MNYPVFKLNLRKNNLNKVLRKEEKLSFIYLTHKFTKHNLRTLPLRKNIIEVAEWRKRQD